MSDQYVLPKVDCEHFREKKNHFECRILKEPFCFTERCKFYKPEEVSDGRYMDDTGSRTA